MPTYDLLIRGGTLVGPDGPPQRADLAVAAGQIVAIGPELEGDAIETIDAAALHAFPALIDAHVHFNEPGRADWEGIASGSAAIAAGGGGLYFDMPLNAHPPTTTVAAFDAKRAAAESASHVDFALWGGLVPGNIDEMEGLAARGAIGFKAFMSNSGIDDFQATDDLTLYEGMVRAASLGRIVAVHAENEAITGGLTRRAIAQGHVAARDYLASRPVVAEIEAIGRAILLAGETGCRLHIVHVSTGRGVALVAEARARGLDVSCETCPHYLVLDEEDLERLGAVAKCAPPLRPRAEQEALWGHIATGTLPMVASDHSPSPAELKAGDDYFRIWGGISGCQSTLQLLLTEGHARRRLPLASIARLVTGFPAGRFGLAPRKGRLAIGSDADIALVDLPATAVLAAADLRYRHQHSPYVGRTLRGRVARTMVRGQTVWRDGRIVSDPIGQLVTPSML